MRLDTFLSEKRTNNVIIVDVQPQYKKYIHFGMDKFCEFLNVQRNLLFFYNGETVGSEDNKDKIINWLWDYGMNETKAEDAEYIDKGYGFFRGWMDMGIQPGTIKQAVRFIAGKKSNRFKRYRRR